MEKLNKFELRNIIQTLHKREDFTIIERLAKFVEKMNDELASLREENDSLKQKVQRLEKIIL